MIFPCDQLLYYKEDQMKEGEMGRHAVREGKKKNIYKFCYENLKKNDNFKS